ncbi:MAG: hypothetical protein ABL958_19095 [Bdellovibrionia bacterium]
MTVRIFILLLLASALSSGCKPPIDEAQDENPAEAQVVQVKVTDKSGNAYSSMYFEVIPNPVPPSKTPTGPSATTDNLGYFSMSLIPGDYALVPGNSSVNWAFTYGSNGKHRGNFQVVDGQTSYQAIYPRVMFLDMLNAGTGGIEPPLTNETNFAVAISISNQTAFCYAGMGIMFVNHPLPTGTYVSIRANNGGQPDPNALFQTPTITQEALVAQPTGAGTAGLSGDFCNGTQTSISLNPGVYWIVVTFPSAVPNSCLSTYCFSVVGSSALPSSGLPVMSSTDGVTWTPKSFSSSGPTPTRHSLDVFLIE